MHHGRKTSVKANLQDVVKRCLNTSDPVILNQLADELRKRRPNKNLEDLEYYDLLTTQPDLPEFMKTPSDQPEPEQDANNENDDSESNHSGNNDLDDPNDSDDSEQSENDDIEYADTDSEAETHEVEVNPNDIHFNANSENSDSDGELNFIEAEP